MRSETWSALLMDRFAIFMSKEQMVLCCLVETNQPHDQAGEDRCRRVTRICCFLAHSRCCLWYGVIAHPRESINSIYFPSIVQLQLRESLFS